MPRVSHLIAFGSLAAVLAGSAAETPQERAASGRFQLELPVDCEIGPVCVVQHFVDMAPGPAFQDHTCGSLTYDGHDGVDIRTLTHAQMEDGVDVVAAAPGIVRLIRDGMADKTIRDEADFRAIDRRNSGNTVDIAHDEGWETKYSHLKNGSIAVKPGDQVVTGQVLGQIGLSGKTQFPHVEFSLRRDGRWVDPFTGLAPGSGCGQAQESLWSETARAALAYRPGGLLASGFSGKLLTYPDFLDRRATPEVSADPDLLIAWLVAWGLRQGDRIGLTITDGAGRVWIEKVFEQPKHQIQVFRYSGRKRPKTGWQSGRYRASVKIERPNGAGLDLIAEQRHEVSLR